MILCKKKAQGAGMSWIKVGAMNHLRVLSGVRNGMILGYNKEDPSNVYLPNNDSPKHFEVGQEVEVFVYTESDGRYIATTKKPAAMVDEMAYLKVVEINPVGAFLDWGLPKDLLLPFGEQKQEISEGRYCTVFIHKDIHVDRVVATQRFHRHIGLTKANYAPGEEVPIQVVSRTDLGYKVVVKNRHWGLLYKNEVFKTLKPGMKTTAWVKKVVDDEKVDLTLNAPKRERFSSAAESILVSLERAGGYLPLHDKSPPDAIRNALEMSKKNFKAAIGQLYKQRKIVFEEGGIRIRRED